MSESRNGLRWALCASVALGAMVGTAMAQQNEAGEVIVNTFTLDYSVGATPQTQITNGDATDPTVGTSFTVDRKVDLDVSSRGDNTSVVPGEQDAPVFFVVTNEGNDNFRYLLTATNRLDATSNDEFDAADIQMAATIVASEASCSATTTFGAGTSVALGAANNTDVPAGGFLCVRVTGDIPAAAANSNDAGLFLTATAVQPAAWANTDPNALPGAAPTAGLVLAPAGANQIDGVAQNVFLDADGAVTADVASDARHSDVSTWIVSSAALTAQKNVFAVATDGSNCATRMAPATSPTGEFAVPGACVVYTIEVNNNGAQAASAVSIGDQLPEGVTFAGIAMSGFTGGTLTPNAGATSCTLNGANRCDVTLSGASLATGATGLITIRALVN